ncbi:DUF1127 domain-containing protein [Nordella sp. HKS 07]|nr:DUF1127 domain-containing protein [Nordella sp. HKS 07]
MSNSSSHPIRQSSGVSVAVLLGRLYGHIHDRIMHFTAVRELESLTDRQLRDIGVDRRQIEEIAAREIARLHAK